MSYSPLCNKTFGLTLLLFYPFSTYPFITLLPFYLLLFSLLLYYLSTYSFSPLLLLSSIRPNYAAKSLHRTIIINHLSPQGGTIKMCNQLKKAAETSLHGDLCTIERQAEGAARFPIATAICAFALNDNPLMTQRAGRANDAIRGRQRRRGGRRR